MNLPCQCPNCNVRPDSAELPSDEEKWKPVKCKGCKQWFVIRWWTTVQAQELAILPEYVTDKPEFTEAMEWLKTHQQGAASRVLSE